MWKLTYPKMEFEKLTYRSFAFFSPRILTKDKKKLEI